MERKKLGGGRTEGKAERDNGVGGVWNSSTSGRGPPARREVEVN